MQEDDDDQRGLVGWVVALGALTAIGTALALALASAMGGFGSASGDSSSASSPTTTAAASTSAGATPATAGSTDGASATASATSGAVSLPVLSKLYFATDVAAVSDEGQSALRAAIEAAKAHPGARLAVSGFHDKTGNADQNHELAKQRATAVRDALVAAGIDTTRIELRKPEVTEGGGDDREARRVEVRVE